MGKRTIQFSRFFLFSAILIVVISCSGQSQVGGMYPLSFSVTPACGFSDQIISFHNDSSEEAVMRGAGISFGTDRNGSFSLQSFKIGNTEQATPSGSLGETHIPAGSDYSFKVRYSPTLENKTETALLDIAYQSPKEGVVQVRLDGSSGSRLPSCDVIAPIGGSRGLNGPVLLKVEHLIAVTFIEAMLDSRLGDTPFFQADIPLTLAQGPGGSEGTAILPPITEATRLALPKPGPLAPQALKDLDLRLPTTITTSGTITGVYDPSLGKIVLNNVHVIMNGDFHTEFNINLTTESLLRPPVNVAALQHLRPLWNDTTGELSGQRIDMAHEGSVVLVGFSRITDVITQNTNLGPLRDSSMAVLIYGNVRAVTSGP